MSATLQATIARAQTRERTLDLVGFAIETARSLLIDLEALDDQPCERRVSDMLRGAEIEATADAVRLMVERLEKGLDTFRPPLAPDTDECDVLDFRPRADAYGRVL